MLHSFIGRLAIPTARGKRESEPKVSHTHLLVCLIGTTLTDLDLAVDAFVDHPVRTRGAHVAVPKQYRVWRFDDLESVLGASEAARRNRHCEVLAHQVKWPRVLEFGRDCFVIVAYWEWLGCVINEVEYGDGQRER